MGESRIERAVDYITKLFQGNGDGHDLAHSMRVYKNALMIADMEGQGEEEIIALSAYMTAMTISFSIRKIMPMPEVFCSRRDFPKSELRKYAGISIPFLLAKIEERFRRLLREKLCRMQTVWKRLALSVLLAASSLAEAMVGAWRIPSSIFMTSFYWFLRN